jgi:hypothetical protein
MLLPISERLHNRSAGYRYHLVRVWQHLWQVLAVILVPLLLLASISAGTLGMILLVRLWTGVDAFFVRQLFLLLVVTIGLILAVLAYTTSIVVALRKIRIWHELHQTKKAHWATWGLGFTALVVLVPLFLAFFMH